MEKISEDILKEIRLLFIGKKIKLEGDGGKHVGLCKFIGYNKYLPSWNLQVTLNRTPISNVKLSSIELYENTNK